MQIRFLKDHLGYSKGTEEDVNDARGRSWIDQGIAEMVDAEKYIHPDATEFIEQGKKKTEKAERAEATHEKNAHAGPKKK